MDKHIRNLLDDLSSKPFRSKFKPHRELIRELRRKRHTYQDIAGFFRAHLQLHVAPSTIHNFLKVRSLCHEPQVSTPEQAPAVPGAMDSSENQCPAKRDRRSRAPDPTTVLRSLRVLLRFLRTAK